LALVSVFALCLAPQASAATKVLAPGEEFTRTVNADFLDSIEYSWSVAPSTDYVDFVVWAPDSSEYLSYSGSSYPVGLVMATISGDYVFEWTNPGTSSVTLTYDLSGDSGIGGAFDFAFWLLVIGAIVIVVIIVVVVIVVLRGSKKQAPPPPAYGPQQFAAPGTPAPYAANTCPKCGGPIDSQQVFCPKCGFKMR